MQLRRWRVVLAVGLALLAIGCTSNQDVTAEPADQVAEPVVAESPINELIGYVPQEWDAAPQTRTARQVWQENELRIQQCMEAKGAQYVVRDFPNAPSHDNAHLSSVTGTREFAETYGFGLSTYFEERVIDDAFYVAQTPIVDPNETYRESLSLSDRRAWDEALNGVGTLRRASRLEDRRS